MSIVQIDNSKVGKVYHISRTPIKSCASYCAATCGKDCYALKAYRAYPTAKACWDANLELSQKDNAEFWRRVEAELSIAPKRAAFRFWVSGDFLDTEDFERAVELTEKFSDIQFLAFTKRYSAVNKVLDRRSLPRNFTVIFSGWQGIDMDNPHNLPMTFISGDPRATWAIPCTGACQDCHACWTLTKGQKVTFDLH